MCQQVKETKIGSMLPDKAPNMVRGWGVTDSVPLIEPWPSGARRLPLSAHGCAFRFRAMPQNKGL